MSNLVVCIFTVLLEKVKHILPFCPYTNGYLNMSMNFYTFQMIYFMFCGLARFQRHANVSIILGGGDN